MRNHPFEMYRALTVVALMTAAAGCESFGPSRKSFEAAKQQDSTEGYDSFIRNHPASSFAEEARPSSQDLADFAAFDADDIDAVEGYLAQHPAGLRVPQARAALSKRLHHFRDTRIDTFNLATDIQGEFPLKGEFNIFVRQTLSPYGRLIGPLETALAGECNVLSVNSG